MQSHNTRFPWVMLLIGLLLGLFGGLAYAWFLNPVTYDNIAPARLSPEDQQAYVLLVAEAYLSDHDLERARARLNTLGVHDVGSMVAVQADSAFLSGADIEQLRALAVLAEALGAASLASEVFAGTPVLVAESPSAAPTATFEGMPVPGLTPSPIPPTPVPTPSPTLAPIPATAFTLRDRDVTCQDTGPFGRLEVYVYDAQEQGVPAVEVLVQWEGGEERFFTGLKPDVSPGYADFQMQPGLRYSVALVGLGEPVFGIDSALCQTPSGQSVIPTYRLVFVPAAASSGP